MFLLFDSKTIPHLSETIANGVMSFLLITEIITATIALKQLANHHAGCPSANANKSCERVGVIRDRRLNNCCAIQP